MLNFVTATDLTATGTAIVLFWLNVAGPVRAGEFSTKIVDGLERPVRDVTVEVYWLKGESNNDLQQVTLAKLHSDAAGIVKGDYDAAAVPPGKWVWMDVAKPGYPVFSSRLQPEFVLPQIVRTNELPQVAALEGEAQKQALKEILAARLEGLGASLDQFIFPDERKWRPALRALVKDPKVGTKASKHLAFIGLPEDLRLVVGAVPPPPGKPLEDRWVYDVVCALLEAGEDIEWDFLRKCASGYYNDRWVDAGAIQTLKLIASAQSIQILQEARQKNQSREASIAAALDYIRSNPSQLADPSLDEAGKKAALAVKVGEWQGNTEPRYNVEGDKALINVKFIAGRDLLIYTATFHRVDGVWKLRGMRETAQALLARPQ